MTKNKHLIFRPCHKCGQLVNCVPWPQASRKENRLIWHHANEDGSHHFCFLSPMGVENARRLAADGLVELSADQRGKV